MGRTALIAFLLIVVTASTALAAGPKFYQTYGNKHNLRGNPANTVTYKAVYNPADRRTDEICIFCHTPHNASPATALWGRKQTVVSSFGHFSSSNLVIDNPGVRDTKSFYNEPNGSSRLCLSCHDGATALGAVLNGPEIVFDAGKTVIAPKTTAGSYNVFNPTIGDRTLPPDSIDDDATKHHHPISFKYDESVRSTISSVKGVTYKFPNIPVNPPEELVKLDRNGYMQCTTCHNPHQDMSGLGSTVPFWVLTKGVSAANDYDTVCLSCHPTPVPSVTPPGW